MVNDMTSQISTLKDEVEQVLSTLGRDLDDTRSAILREIVSLKHVQDKRIKLDPDAGTTMAEASDYPSDIAISLVLLDSLAFEGMHYRQTAIFEAYHGTFEWAFKHELRSWLRSSDPIFWISGKPGSGKSTLMKYLVSNPRTSIALRHRPGLENLVIAKYFFWINGTEQQRSLEGLLRALLYDMLHGILRQNPELIKHILPEAWQSVSKRLASAVSTQLSWASPEWTRPALLQAFQRISTLKKLTTNFCIFVDGLDEYDGDHEELIKVINYLTMFGAKLCVASRPWNVFEDAFGSNAVTKLYLQDLNKKDIQLYVEEKLRKHPNFQRIDSEQAHQIINDIVEKSRGVFLWVRLAVRSLTEGLRNRDNLALLQKRLDAFPSDLDQFFRHMFTSLDPTYRTHLSHMFQVAISAHEPLSTIAYWFLDEIESDPNLALTMPAHILDARRISEITEEMAVRINGRSKGLLEITKKKHFEQRRLSKGSKSYLEARVDFLHRTVKDFIMTTEMEKMLADWQQPHFQPDMALCKIMLAEFKTVALTSRAALESRQTIQYLMKQFFKSAQHVERRTKTSPIAYIEELERVNHARPLVGRRGEWDSLDCVSLSTAAEKYGLWIFLAERKEKNQNETSKNQSKKHNIEDRHSRDNIDELSDVTKQDVPSNQVNIDELSTSTQQVVPSNQLNIESAFLIPRKPIPQTRNFSSVNLDVPNHTSFPSEPQGAYHPSTQRSPSCPPTTGVRTLPYTHRRAASSSLSFRDSQNRTPRRASSCRPTLQSASPSVDYQKQVPTNRQPEHSSSECRADPRRRRFSVRESLKCFSRMLR